MTPPALATTATRVVVAAALPWGLVAALVASLVTAPAAAQEPATSAGYFAFAAAVPASKAAPAWQLTVRSDHHSDALPLAVLGDDDWQHLAPRPGRNLAYLDDEVRLQRRSGDWTWGLLARSQASVVASRETLQLARAVDSGKRPATDTHWAADMRLRAFSGAGLLVARSQVLAPGWTGGVSAQALALGGWRSRSISGPVAYDAARRSYSFALQSHEVSNRLDYPYQQAFARRGAGLLLGAELAWTAGDWSASAALRDGGWLHWRGVPQQQASLVTDRQGVDADGFLVYGPLIEGRNRQDGLTQRQPWRGQLALSRHWGRGQQLGVSLDTLPDFGVLPAVQWQCPVGEALLGLGWRLHERRLTVALDWRGFSLRAGADRLDAAARSRALALAYGLAF